METTLKKINKSLKKGGLTNSSEFLISFLDKENEILSLLKDFKGSKSEIYLNETDKTLSNLLKFSALFSDITLLNTTPSSINDYHFTFHEPGSKYYVERQLTIPVEYLNEMGNDPKSLLPCYIHRNDSETKKIFKTYTPLIKSNKLLVRPMRALYVNFYEIGQGTVYYADPNTDNNHWYINKIQKSESIIIDSGYLSYSNVTDLFNITLPYFTDIDLDLFAKILEDENEILNEFRRNLTKVIQEAGGDLHKIEEIKNDITLNSITRLNRKFKAIQEKHRIAVGASLGNFILTLSLGNIDMESLLKGLTTSLTIIGVSEYDFRSKKVDLKDDPYFLLWRINKKI
jgi:hypothetical protein